MQIDIDHPAVQAGVEALSGHHPERGGQESQQAVFAILQAAQPFFEASHAPEGQMFFDHGSDSFLAEVGQILRIDHISININDVRSVNTRVRVAFHGYDVNFQRECRAIALGRSYGECLYRIRQNIRELTGR